MRKINPLSAYLTLSSRQASIGEFRVRYFYIATTWLDPELYPAKEIADLYFRRWDVELSFRHIKTTRGMDILRCKSPEMVVKEIVMHMIVYNGIRQLMQEAPHRGRTYAKPA